MQLTGPEILNRMHSENGTTGAKPDIVIEPFDVRCLGSNSYDLHLANKLRVYRHTVPRGMRPALKYVRGTNYTMANWFETPDDFARYIDRPYNYDIRNPKYLLDPCDAKCHETLDIEIPKSGLILSPTIGYLGATVEYTETRNLFPYIDGKSSVGRNFILNHHTAGRGDDGFCGAWTLEIHVLYPTVVYPNMRIGQIYYEEFIGPRKPYNEIKTSHYNGQQLPTPAAVIPIDEFLEKQR